MINIDPLIIDNDQFAKEAFESKKDPRKTTLLASYVYVKDDYHTYNANRLNLERMSPDARVSGIREELLHCYDSSTEIVDEVKQKIKDNIPTKKKGRCLYCMISEATTLDHYIDKSDFPEFAIYTDNLIPCCASCNTRKKAKWRNGAQRLIINNYFDTLITDNYLYIDIGFSREIPFVQEVRLDFAAVTATTYSIELVKNHYELLDLKNRYKDKATDLLDGIVEEFTEPYKIDRPSCLNTIYRRISALEKKHGRNHWEAAVYRGVLANNDLIDWMTE